MDVEVGDFSHTGVVNAEEDDILRYLLSDTPSTTDSTPDSSPPHMFEDSTPDVSPVHWSQDSSAAPPVVPQLSELSLDLNPEMLLYGSNFTSDFNNSFMSVPLSAPTTPPKDTLVALPPLMPIQPQPIVTPPPHVQVPIVVEPPKKQRQSKKRQRVDEPSVPSPQDKVALPRDTLLNITSQSMERYVETLQTTRSLTSEDQKELRRQKRLIKNRESAQLSRERKRAYIDQLEAKIAQLVADNGALKTDNTALRETLARYQATGVKIEPSQDLVSAKGQTQHQIKMGSLFSVKSGSTSKATAGVCLLIVLFSFGLFMNVNKPTSNMLTRYPQTTSAFPELNVLETRALAPVEIGMKRGLLEAFPEVKEEENDTEPYESAAKLPKVLPFVPPSSAPTPPNSHRHVIRLAGSPSARRDQQKFEIKPAGVFTVSYSPDPATFVDGEHSHEEKANSTFHLILDPRPDLDDTDIENDSVPVSATHETQLDIATSSNKKTSEPHFPPMIISLVIPDDIANGSNPLLLPEGLNPSNSLMEITCQVVDISITTSEQPGN